MTLEATAVAMDCDPVVLHTYSKRTDCPESLNLSDRLA